MKLVKTFVVTLCSLGCLKLYYSIEDMVIHNMSEDNNAQSVEAELSINKGTLLSQHNVSNILNKISLNNVQGNIVQSVSASESTQIPKEKSLSNSKTSIEGYKCNISDSELKILNELKKRKLSLDEREDDIRTKEEILTYIRAEIKEKTQELKNLRAETIELLEKYEVNQDANITSLVKVYEAMNPKSAAIIFNSLEEKILLDVAVNMSETKLSGIIAKMDPEQAQKLTRIFITRSIEKK